MKRLSFFAVLILIAALLAPAAHAAETQASAVVKNFYAELTATMKQGDQLGFAGRYKKLEPAVKSAFNLPLMTRFAVGLTWDKASPAEQQQLTDAFSSFSIANYASQFKRYDGEQFAVTGEKPASGGVIVETTLTPKGGSPVTLNYMMRTDEKGDYRIVDVYLDGAISELAARRSEFSAIANRDGIPALVNSLDAKSKQMGPS